MAIKEAFCLCLQLLLLPFVSSDINFTFNGFIQANLSLDGDAYVRSDGILTLTNYTTKILGHALYPFPLQFKESNPNNNTNKSSVVSFSTNFIFSINPKYPATGGHGLAFVLFPDKPPKGCLSNEYLGIPIDPGNAKFTTRALAIEFDVVQDLDLFDIDDNHVGIDLSSLISNISEPASYSQPGSSSNNSIIFKNGGPVRAWVEYNSQEKLMNVTICPLGTLRPSQPLISFPIDLSSVIDEYMYVGFSASTGLLTAAHNVLGWSFRIGGKALDLDPSKLPSPVPTTEEAVHRKGLATGITLACVTLVLFVIYGAVHVIKRIKNGQEILEDWEVEYGAHRFKYRELFAATRGFGERNLIGSGGFGRVYKGIVPSTGLEVAIKRVSPNSLQGMREFVAEITSMGRLRHRNLVQLHGWCRRQDELLLVYDYIPNGSLDKLLEDSNHQKKTLTWEQRYKILTGVAQALMYLHEECEQMVVHRDVKPSNVLIDAELNARLGDFGLARIYEHGINPQTTHIVGTLGYLAPELAKTGKSTTCTDVYGYGALMLEVASGRRPIEPQRSAAELVLVDWVRELHSRGEISRAIDPNLEEYNPDEAELVLGLGLLCSHPNQDYRPSMRRVVEFLLGDASLPQLPPDLHLEAAEVITDYSDIYEEYSGPSSGKRTSSKSTSFTTFDKNVSSRHTTRVTF